MTARYLGAADIARLLGVSAGTIRAYIAQGRLPPPDATIGTVRGWTRRTIDDWQRNRPGRGARTDLARQR